MTLKRLSSNAIAIEVLTHPLKHSDCIGLNTISPFGIERLVETAVLFHCGDTSSDCV